MASYLPPVPPTVVFMEKAMVFERLRGNLFKIIDPNTGIVRIAEAPIIAESITNAARCYRDFRTEQTAEIIQFPSNAAGH